MSLKTSIICNSALEVLAALIAHEADIENLDRAIGDGDHYINIKRGAETVALMVNDLKDLSPEEALNKIAMKLLSTVGGAAGPLLASFFMEMAKIVKQNQANNSLEFAQAFAAGVQGIVHRGKAALGEKTMLDVLIPVSITLTNCSVADKNVSDICRDVKATADQGLESTRNLIATKGRAAGLGERAIGHLDAGAKSCQVMVHAVCDLLLKENQS
jgi:phosphoenolpyruvate---glycerone phosphotransferase subunit DhaL